jgi:hypothetical protein
MSTIRFPTVQDLYEAFPTAAEDVGVPSSTAESLSFLRSLVAKEAWKEATAFSAYLLPRREAIWWGCESVRHIQPTRLPHETAALDLAEAWVHEPEDGRRHEALDLALRSDPQSPTTWMLYGVGWSGGSVVQSQYGMVPPLPQQTARAVRAGMLIALAWVPKGEISRTAKPCFESAIKLAMGEQNS